VNRSLCANISFVFTSETDFAGILEEMRDLLIRGERGSLTYRKLTDELNNTLPFKDKVSINSVKEISQHLDLMQVSLCVSSESCPVIGCFIGFALASHRYIL